MNCQAFDSWNDDNAKAGVDGAKMNASPIDELFASDWGETTEMEKFFKLCESSRSPQLWV